MCIVPVEDEILVFYTPLVDSSMTQIVSLLKNTFERIIRLRRSLGKAFRYCVRLSLLTSTIRIFEVLDVPLKGLRVLRYNSDFCWWKFPQWYVHVTH